MPQLEDPEERIAILSCVRRRTGGFRVSDLGTSAVNYSHQTVETSLYVKLLIVVPSRWKKAVCSYIARDLLSDVPAFAR